MRQCDLGLALTTEGGEDGAIDRTFQQLALLKFRRLHVLLDQAEEVVREVVAEVADGQLAVAVDHELVASDEAVDGRNPGGFADEFEEAREDLLGHRCGALQDLGGFAYNPFAGQDLLEAVHATDLVQQGFGLTEGEFTVLHVLLLPGCLPVLSSARGKGLLTVRHSRERPIKPLSAVANPRLSKCRNYLIEYSTHLYLSSSSPMNAAMATVQTLFRCYADG